MVSPVTNPVELIVATTVLEEVHGLTMAGVPEPLSCEVLPLQKVNEPLRIGFGLIVIVKVAVVAHCPTVGVNV